MPVTQVVIGTTAYELSPLRMKYIKQVSALVKEQAPTEVYASVSRFFPIITASIQTKNPTFTEDKLEDATLEQVLTAWAAVVDVSGITITTKVGEPKPTKDSTGASSTEGLQPASAGTTVQ